MDRPLLYPPGGGQSAVAIATATALLLAASTTAALECRSGVVIEGQARVHDGDTLRVGDTRIRLQGIAAPELKEPGGRAAGAFLRELVRDYPVRCTLDGTRNRDRCVATCLTPDGEDVAKLEILAGLARDCPAFSRGRYRAAEREAERAGFRPSRLPFPNYCR